MYSANILTGAILSIVALFATKPPQLMVVLLFLTTALIFTLMRYAQNAWFYVSVILLLSLGGI
ncbi:hypothetical protein RA27_06460 [Ruegeria sp. ANG-R]|uniref:hypothetical protein n=1 Tax=Ruegeria sp. ANG-R TaxID=1577903 RepID=UPI00057CEFF1|nr:hypothetical protein [Ruegeria sp. ANG-R]KIC42961.1 hypothetical protein RA27_06460 [Ruegeria sp. ANG-R]